jgi:uncharacterized protein (TIGR00266 family)
VEHQIKYGPAFSTLFVTLNPGDLITAEAGAMASMDGAVTMKTVFAGGFFVALMKRIFGGETLLVNQFSNQTSQPLQLVLTQSVVGDLHQIQLDYSSICFQPGAYLAHIGDIKLGLQWAGFASFIAREGLFRLKASGNGTVFFGAYGGISEQSIDGELVVDSGHLVAYDPHIKLSLGLAGGLFGSITSGEGIISRLSGQGRVFLQSRSIDGLVRFLRPRL